MIVKSMCRKVKILTLMMLCLTLGAGLSGCAAAVVGAAVGVTGAAVKGTAKAGGAAVDLAIPDGDEEDD